MLICKSKAIAYYALIGLSAIILVRLSSCSTQTKIDTDTRTVSFDKGWFFIKDNPSGAENPEFNHSSWRRLDLPHDWSIEDLPDQKPDSVLGPFSKASIGKMFTGYTIGGTAWYRKQFTINRQNRNKIVYLIFDGIYMNADVWINGKHVGNHPYGYTSFYYDITSYLNEAGKSNIVAVQVKNEGKTSRWYSGSGIYRHTWLTFVEPLHIGVWGINIKTQKVTENNADIKIITTLVNSGKESEPATVRVEITDPSENIVGTAASNIDVTPGSKSDLEQSVSLENPVLWSPENPKLYSARVTLMLNNKVSDYTSTSFGIRTVKIDAKNGLTINGKPIKLVGGCFHHDNGPLGSAAIDRAEERKIELFKNAGYNAIRCSHNPPSPYLLDVCDRLGVLVIDEIFDNWEKEKISPDDYSRFFKEWNRKDIESMVLRDRNHPSVILWSIGNEIPEAFDTAGLRIARNLCGEIRQLDSTRGITEAFVDVPWILGQKSNWDDQKNHMELLDVVGYNYMYLRYEADHKKFPDRVMMATEFQPIYSLENWQMVKKHSYVIGNFAWVIMDYLGEAGVGLSKFIPDNGTESKKEPEGSSEGFFNNDPWPVFNDYQGDLDLIGNNKARHYYQLVVWQKSPVEILVHRPIPAGIKEIVSPWGWPDELKSWSWPGHEGEKMMVNVYTRSNLVKLELNGKLVGEQVVDGEKSITATFVIPYEPGTLIARCFNNGTETASQTLITAGKPQSIRLTADRSEIKADPNDLAYVMAEVVDADGNTIPWADDILINFEITGTGKLAGVGNGNPEDMSSFQRPRKKTFHGICLAIIRPEATPGRINIRATAEGLKDANLVIAAK
jgi:beta-galactosidase